VLAAQARVGAYQIGGKAPHRCGGAGKIICEIVTFGTGRASEFTNNPATMDQTRTFNVLLVDDHHMLRMGLIAMAESSSGYRLHWLESGNLADALVTYRSQPNVDLVLLDMNLPDSQGLHGVQRFLAEYPQARVAIFSATEDEFIVRQALAMGALGYIPKSASAGATLGLVESLLAAVTTRTATASAQPGRWRPGILSDVAVDGPDPGTGTVSTIHARAAMLNGTQLKVLELLLAGMSNQEIASACSLALGTVKNAVSSIFLVLDVHSRSHLISMFR